MAIRITGLNSGLDTESIISELVKAQNTKKDTLVKAQKRLNYKQDAWKSLNAKVYNFYTTMLDDLQYQYSYQKKTTKVSNSSAVSVVTKGTAVNGSQDLKISKLAKPGYLTGGQLSDSKEFTTKSTMKDLGLTGESTINITTGGKTTELKLTEGTKISDVLNQLQSAGVNANFDEENQRFFISAQKDGKDNDFALTAGDANGLTALKTLGLYTAPDVNNEEYKNTTEYKEYSKWANYTNQELTDMAAFEALKRVNDYYTANRDLTAKNATLSEQNTALHDKNQELTDKNADLTKEIQDLGYNGDSSEVLKEKIEASTDETEKAALEAQLEKALKKETLEADIESNKKAIEDNTESIKANSDAIAANQKTITDNQAYFTESTVTDDNGNEVLTLNPTQALKTKVYDEYDAKRTASADALAGNAEGTNSSTATRIYGQDALIYLNGAKFTSDTNVFEINGLTITAQQETGDEVISLNTMEDTEGIYDLIKNFFTEYNKLINEMDSLYNADDASSYQPLTSEEKDAMTDTEIEEWEKKITDSILRRDSTLGTVSDALKNIMLSGLEVNGKKMYLSDFGIGTLGYFNSAENEKNAYHIDGDSEDSATKNNEDKLRAMIASDPNTVIDFFTGLSKNMYSKLTKLMETNSSSSAFTLYNDKDMKSEYEDYSSDITAMEKKITAMEEKWYQKFAAMETALATLNSKQSAITSLLGG